MFESGNIRALVFDLDGTLVETEHLKALAYAELVGRLTGNKGPEPGAIELYRSVVGATDFIVCDAMIDRFDLLPHLPVNRGEEPVQTLHRLRMELYRASYGTSEKLSAQVYEHNVALARQAHAEGLSVAVATMSFSDEAQRVLGAIGLSGLVKAVVGVDHVENPKPAPDAFVLAMSRLSVHPADALIIEDSPRGARAAAASGARWLCVATPFSIDALRAESGLDDRWIVWDPSGMDDAVSRRITG